MADKEKNAGQEAAVKKAKKQRPQTPPNPARTKKTVRKRKRVSSPVLPAGSRT